MRIPNDKPWHYRRIIALIGCATWCASATPLFAFDDVLSGSDVNSAGLAPTLDSAEDDLGKRLLEGRTDDKNVDPMDRILHLMDRAAQRMHDRFDAGLETQDMQQQIIKQLDDAIEIALRNRTKMSATSSAGSDRRTMPNADQSKAPSDSGNTGEQSDSPQRQNPVVDENEDQTRGGAFREGRRMWGRLPQRDRDQIMQGMDDAFVEPYRDLIEAYYESLAQPDGQLIETDRK